MITLLLAGILILPASLEGERPRIEAAIEAGEVKTLELCVERRYPKKLLKKPAKVARKCQKKVNKIKVICVDDFHVKCGKRISPTGYCAGVRRGKKVTMACQLQQLEGLYVHEACHVIAGSRSGHNGVPECAKR